VEEYRQKMELFMISASIEEKEDLTIARFLSGSNFGIKDRVEQLPYKDLNDLVQMCIKVEQQLIRKSSSKHDQAFSNSYAKTDSKKEKEKPQKKLAKHFHTFALVRLNVSNAWVEDT